MSRLFALGIALAVLGGCGTAVYDKPGLTYAEWKRDDGECREKASTARGLDSDAYARCMRERGYKIPER